MNNPTSIDSHIENLRRQLEQAEAVKRSIEHVANLQKVKDIDELIKQKQQERALKWKETERLYAIYEASRDEHHEKYRNHTHEVLDLELKKLQILMPKETVQQYGKTYEVDKLFDFGAAIPNYSCPSNSPMVKVYMRHFVQCGLHPAYVARLTRSTYQTVNRYANDWGNVWTL